LSGWASWASQWSQTSQGGHTLWLTSRSGVPQELTTAGGKACASAKEVAAEVRCHHHMVPDTPDVEKVCSPRRLWLKDWLRKIVVAMSSISPIETMPFADRIRKSGADYVDAPSPWRSGCKNGAADHHGWCFRTAFAKVKPLSTDGKNITLVGGVAPADLQVCNQIIVALNIEAVARHCCCIQSRG